MGLSVESCQPPAAVPSNQNAIVMACDAAYLLPALFVAHQLLAQPKRPYDIIIMRTDVSPGEALPSDDGILFIAAKDKIAAALPPNVAVSSAAAYARLLIHRVLPHGYWKVLYLDCDIWIGTHDLQALFGVDLAGYPIAAVRDNSDVFSGSKNRFALHKKAIGMSPAAAYFNSGVLLIDLERWIAERICERTLAYIAEGNNIEHQDQTALNAVIDGRWRELPSRWNWTHSASIRLTEQVRPAIVHFIGSSKPWNDHRARYPSHYGEEMRAFYARRGHAHFYKPPSTLHYARRQASRLLRSIRALVYDRRERAIRKHMLETDFLLPPEAHQQ